MASNNSKGAVSKEAALTPVSDKTGHTIFICAPQWFDERKMYKIANAPARTAALEFSGSDLNLMARVLYAEAAGSAQLIDKADRDKEKSAIMNVNHFRLNRKGYPRDDYIATSWRMVCYAKGQFESVFEKTPKFKNAQVEKVDTMSKAECSDLDEAIAGVKAFMENGPDPQYLFDNFRGYDPKGAGTHVGRSRFFLSDTGRKLAAKNP